MLHWRLVQKPLYQALKTKGSQRDSTFSWIKFQGANVLTVFCAIRACFSATENCPQSRLCFLLPLCDQNPRYLSGYIHRELPASSQHKQMNLKRNLHTKLLITVIYFGNILFIINTFPGVSSANSQHSPHLQTAGISTDSEWGKGQRVCAVPDCGKNQATAWLWIAFQTLANL